MENERGRPRILFLDGLRCVAILAVVLHHYFSRWTPPRHSENLYPYGDVFLPLFKYGFYGVQLFFIVSGFVIALTLYKCAGPLEFGVRRLARLWPSMALCSMVTLLLVRVIPNHTFHVSPLGLIPSLTFLDPGLPNKFFHTQVFDWIDGSYWSLFVEVRFYFLAALLFYSRRNKFAGNVYLFGRIVLSLSLLAAVLHLERFGKVFDLFFIAQYLPWFLIGIAFFMLEKRVEQPFRDGLFLLGILSLLARAALDRSYLAAAMAVVIPLFFLAASSVSLVKRVLSQRLLTGVGAASYSLYLLHGYIGVALIGWLANFLRFRGEYSAVLAILTTVVVTIISQLIYTYWETPLDRFIVAKLKPKVSRVKAPDLPVAPAIEAHSAAFPLTIDDPVA